MLFRKLWGAKAIFKAHDQVSDDDACKIIGLLFFNLFKRINQRVEINNFSVEQDAQNRFVKLKVEQYNGFNVFMRSSHALNACCTSFCNCFESTLSFGVGSFKLELSNTGKSIRCSFRCWNGRIDMAERLSRQVAYSGR